MSNRISPWKKRISPWLNPWLMAIAIGLLLLGVPMVLWLMTYHSDIAVQMFVITWVCLTGFVVAMAKSSLIDSRYYVSKKILTKTRREIETHRSEVRKEFLKTELEVLNRGRKTPVLDVWRLDPSLQKRHIFFSSLVASILDPESREIHFRIQLDDIRNPETGLRISESALLNHIGEFLKVIAVDPYLAILRKFFDRIVLVIDALREDEHHVDRPYPVLSMALESGPLTGLASLPAFDGRLLLQNADVRFDGGNEIEPHRDIQSDATIQAP